MKIYFIRHAETRANVEQRYSSTGSSPLTEKGLKQVDSLLIKFPVEEISGIYTSPLERCVSLALKLGEKSKITPVFDERLVEFKFGIFDNMTWQQAETTYPMEFDMFCKSPGTYKLPEGESQDEFDGRIRSFIDYIRDNDANIAVVTHAGVIRSALAYILDLDDAHKWKFRIMNASVTLIEICDGHACLVLQELK
ncbi:MAG TPA: histidine phosphatase family protein [Clostridia bacterium]|nr:histidine phosphatase family protein [Clostridia bacterium]HPQ46349.1 histidine phosphatase family protein [Clostridia bacterium]HRX41909.1 histidine phosphatase family protein [Clostridia bacterium]